MTKERFIELTGEDPIDVLGADWKEVAADFLNEREYTHDGHEIGSCYHCKVD